MKESIKNFGSLLKNKAAYAIALLGVAMSNATVALADGETSDRLGGTTQDWSLTSDDKTTIGTVLRSLAALFTKWSLPFIIIAIVMMLVTKDDKKKEMYKKLVIGLVIAYIICLLLDPIYILFNNMTSNFH